MAQSQDPEQPLRKPSLQFRANKQMTWIKKKKKGGSKLSCITQLYYHGLLPLSNPYIPFPHPPI